MPSIISIIIVGFNVRQYLLDCLDSIDRSCKDLEYEEIVVDNASDDGTDDAVRRKSPGTRVIENKVNAGFARANNQGYAVSSGGYLLLLNPDTVLKPGAVRTVLDFLERTPDCGLAGCRLLNSDGSLQKSIKRFPSPLNNLLTALCLDKLTHSTEWVHSYYKNKSFKVDYVSGAFMMVRRKALIGQPYLLNPDYYMYSEEKDLALRLKEKGWSCYFVPGAEIVHHGGQSTGQMPEEMYLELQRSQVKFFYAHHKGAYARLLDLTWWLVIFCSWLKSLPISVISGQSSRTTMMWRAVREYPKFERPESS